MKSPSTRTTGTTATPRGTGAGRRRRTRSVVVGVAVLACAAIWSIARAAGADLIVDLGNGQPPQTVGLPIVVAFSAQAAILGWITLALLERFVNRARLIWTLLATAALLLSFIPLAVAQADAGTKVALSLMHLAVAGALIPFLPRGNS